MQDEEKLALIEKTLPEAWRSKNPYLEMVRIAVSPRLI